MYLLSCLEPACCHILCRLLNNPVCCSPQQNSVLYASLMCQSPLQWPYSVHMHRVHDHTWQKRLCFTACRKRIIQYRNERQELAACQRLQEGKEHKQVPQAADTCCITVEALTGPPVAITGLQTSPTDHNDTVDLSHLLPCYSAWWTVLQYGAGSGCGA